MSFNISLSGLSAAQKDLDTTSNNIANVNTTGFKMSRAEFADVYATSIFSNSKTSVGNGVTTAQVAQQFAQGSTSFTNNSLDMAISGAGFFVTSHNPEDHDYSYSRAGAFKLDAHNYIVNSNSDFLQTFPVDATGHSTSISLTTTQPLQIPQVAGSPKGTSIVNMQVNLDSTQDTLDPNNFDPDDSSTYNTSTSVTIYDSLGEAHIMSSYFLRPKDAADGTQSSWLAFYMIDGQRVDVANAATYMSDPGQTGTVNTPTPAQSTGPISNPYTPGPWQAAVITFDQNGAFLSQDPTPITTVSLGNTGASVLGPGADPSQVITMRYNQPTQYASDFNVGELNQNGQTVGRLTNVQIAEDGLIVASYSNGANVPLGRVALVKFANEQGLTQVGNTSWRTSVASGDPLAGEPNAGTFGAINASALESSNVDLTGELVNLISAQRNYQANSRSLQVESSLLQTIIAIQ